MTAKRHALPAPNTALRQKNEQFQQHLYGRTRRSSHAGRDSIQQHNPSKQGLIANVRHQGHKPRPLYSLANGMLTGCRATRFSTRDDAAVAIYQFRKQFDIFVVNIHRARPFAINQQGILLLDPNFHSGTFARNSLSIWRSTTEGSLEI